MASWTTQKKPWTQQPEGSVRSVLTRSSTLPDGRASWRPLLSNGGAVVAVALPRFEWECVPCAVCEVI
jgi:hypothetical protein